MTRDIPSNGSIFFIASTDVAIIPFENVVYLSDSQSRDVFGMPNESGFSSCIKFPNYENVEMYICNFFIKRSCLD